MGWQYQHEKWTRRLEKARITQSMSRKGNRIDNDCVSSSSCRQSLRPGFDAIRKAAGRRIRAA